MGADGPAPPCRLTRGCLSLLVPRGLGGRRSLLSRLSYAHLRRRQYEKNPFAAIERKDATQVSHKGTPPRTEQRQAALRFAPQGAGPPGDPTGPSGGRQHSPVQRTQIAIMVRKIAARPRPRAHDSCQKTRCTGHAAPAPPTDQYDTQAQPRCREQRDRSNVSSGGCRASSAWAGRLSFLIAVWVRCTGECCRPPEGPVGSPGGPAP